ncbi:von Willebrand factor type A domain-containing protein [Melghirimyces profundicolus]|uniref:von Willebrand factor type A domain-containing protein n=1 Tax=Melghirimyces profundicolus TaxID=1242148 RepID=A0A2T6C8F6_9BACL|nr:VWA domain-containing protein [Melghirimyces profundicolus]PTX64583.1 von Willebrand factor type A domain-containing protein [Melghirimyces profundicolus]
MAAPGKGDGGTLYLTFIPELEMPETERARDYMFLIDISSSMMGTKMEEAKNALLMCLRNLSEGDTFNMIAFESECHHFSKQGSVTFRQDTLDRATRWIRNLEPMGGTEIFQPIRLALQGKTGPKDRRVLLFTDGQVGNEREITQSVKRTIGRRRMFPFGIDTSVNEAFIHQLAENGNGKSVMIYPGEPLEEKILLQFQRIASPMVEGLKLEGAGMILKDVVPKRLPGLFHREPMTVMARFDGSLPEYIHLTGQVEGVPLTMAAPVEVAPQSTQPLLEKIWARNKLKEMEAELPTGNPRRDERMEKEMVALSKQFQVLCGRTSFVSVLERMEKATGLPVTETVPVAPPRGWDMMGRRAGTGRRFFSLSLQLQDFMSEVMEFSRETGFDGKNFKSEEAVEGGPARKDDLSLPSLLRVLARNQLADGAFHDRGETDASRQLGITAVALLAFLSPNAEIRLYQRQLQKAIRWFAQRLSDTAGDDAVALMEEVLRETEQGSSSKPDLSMIRTRLAQSRNRMETLLSRLRDEAELESRIRLAKEESDVVSVIAELALRKAM